MLADATPGGGLLAFGPDRGDYLEPGKMTSFFDSFELAPNLFLQKCYEFVRVSRQSGKPGCDFVRGR